MVGVDDSRAGGRCRRASAASRPVAPAFAVCVWRTSGRRSRMSRRSARIAAESARGDSSRWSTGSRSSVDAELVRDVLHRLLAGGERPGDDDDVVAAARLLVGELEDVQRGAAHVQPRDHVHDRSQAAAHERACGDVAATARRGDADREPEDGGERDAAEEGRTGEPAGERRDPGRGQVRRELVADRRAARLRATRAAARTTTKARTRNSSAPTIPSS